ncbi:MAG: FAD-binding oxidoreductase [Bacteroidales bacterium]|nr:FAD-binding oxidoreductase [Bacteroidales bacterium]
MVNKCKIYSDKVHRILYSTDASIYKMLPFGVCFPNDEEDIHKVIMYAVQNNLSIIPRGAGTSLAGQAIGEGIVVDNSRFFNKIIEVNTTDKYVIVQPGIVRDVLNKYLFKYNLFFPPETSTSNRCTIGGMIGNNSCGTRALVYGTTRDYIIELSGFFSDGTYATIKNFDLNNFNSEKFIKPEIVELLHNVLSNVQTQQIIKNSYPSNLLVRNNTGYAINVLLDDYLNYNCISLPKLIAGSEGTLFFVTKAKLRLVELPPNNTLLVCVHLSEFYDCFDANLIALKYNPFAVELMDAAILNLALSNPEQKENSFFVKDKPAAILVVEFNSDDVKELQDRVNKFITHLKQCGLGYHYPIISGENIKKVWKLREAGLGVMSNIKGYAKPVSIVEDTCVPPESLKAYISEVDYYFKSLGLSTVYYGHISTGELHFKPILNLRNADDIAKMKELTSAIVKIVKKYKGSISGEHGDGLLRSCFIPEFLGDKVYAILKKIKYTFDPYNLFNPGKIVDPLPNDKNLKFSNNYKTLSFNTYFKDYDISFQNTVENCNGSADCIRKTNEGIMCPTFRATHNEYYSTRGRANFLREMMQQDNFFKNKDVYEILSNCLSCKACKSECPSNIDMTKFKAEFMQQYYNKTKISVRNYIIASVPIFYKYFSYIPQIYNFFVNNKLPSLIIKKILNFEKTRSLPKLNRIKLIKPEKNSNNNTNILLFIDEFSAYVDTHITEKVILLLNKLKYNVIISKPIVSGRTYLSKGFVDKASNIINKNLRYIKRYFNNYDNIAVVGIEPSAVFTYKDESLELCAPELKDFSKTLAANVFTIEEFLLNEIKKGKIILRPKYDAINVHLHVHCYFRVFSDSKIILELLTRCGYNVSLIDAQCCGMAGSFGYEKEHYELSKKIAEPLINYVRNMPPQHILCANGLSCRQQIFDLTGLKALHPVELLC